MSYNLITFSNYFHWIYTKNGCLVWAAIDVSVAILLIIQENGKMLSNPTKIFRWICIVKHEHINFLKKLKIQDAL